MTADYLHLLLSLQIAASSKHQEHKMSDDDMMMSEEEDYGFDYEDASDPEDEDDVLVRLENQYYTAKGRAAEDDEAALDDALGLFREVVDMEEEKGDWGFKAWKQTVKLHLQRGELEKMMSAYRNLLTYTKAAVTRNKSEKAILSILDTVSHSNNRALLHEFYDTTLDSLREAQNERLWFKTKLAASKLAYKSEDYAKALKALKELHEYCETDKSKRGTQLLEVYALEIQVYTATKNTKKLKALYDQSLCVKSGVPHPRTLGIIRECGGKAHLQDHNWTKAYEDFWEAFKNYDEAGSKRRIRCLKYLVLANMLSSSDINPFDSAEAKALSGHGEIVVFTDLVQAYGAHDIPRFEKILRHNYTSIMSDRFIKAYIDDLLKNLRTSVLLQLLQPYTRITIPFISQQLNIPENEVEHLLVSLILDDRIQGRIDQVRQLVVLTPMGDANSASRRSKHAAMAAWATGLSSLHQAALHKLP